MTPDAVPPSSPLAASPATDDGAFGRAVLTLVLGMGGFLSVGLLVQVLHAGWGLWVTEVLIFLGVPFVLLQVTGQHPLVATRLGRPWAAGAGWGFALGLVNFFALAVPLMWAARQVLPEEVLQAFDGSKIFLNQRPGDLALLIAGVCLAAPLCEEYFFRGVVQPGLMRRMPPARAVVLSAFLFSAFHLDPVGFWARFELGVLFGLLAWRTGSLWPSICAHAANNLVSSVSFFATRSDADQPLAWWVPLSMLMAGSAGLLALARLARVRPQVTRAPPSRDVPEGPRLGLLRAAAPWLAGTVLSLGLLLAVDYTAVATNVIDVATPANLPGRPPPTAEEEAQLKAWRLDARAGKLSLEDYRTHREHLVRALRERQRAGDQVKR